MKNILNSNTDKLSLKKIDWQKIQLDMKDKFGSAIYESWLRKIDFVEEFKNYILISVSTRFIRDWIASRYLDQILQIVKLNNKDISRIEFTISEKKENNVNDQKTLRKTNGEAHINQNVSFIKDSFLQYNRIDPNKNFDNFILGQVINWLLKLPKKYLKIWHGIIHYIYMAV